MTNIKYKIGDLILLRANRWKMIGEVVEFNKGKGILDLLVVYDNAKDGIDWTMQIVHVSLGELRDFSDVKKLNKSQLLLEML